MSRSRKSVPGWTDNGKHRRSAKRYSNKRVRQTKDIPNGRAFRKVADTWNICDYRWLHFERPERFEDFCKDWSEKSWTKTPWIILWHRGYMK
jgi:hypothetical protein